jgi:hypothetical protein
VIDQPTNDGRAPETEYGNEAAFSATASQLCEVRTSGTAASIDGSIRGATQSGGSPFSSAFLEESVIVARLLQQNDTLDEALKAQILNNDIPIDVILKAGVKALSQAAPSSSNLARSPSDQEWDGNPTYNSLLRTDKLLVLQNANQESPQRLPDPRINNFRIKQVLFTAACVANAAALGFSYEATTCDNTESPFFQASVSEDNAKTICLNSFQELKEHLRPCPTQLVLAHHPYIDVLPFPTFRERLIKLAYTDSPMIDEDDLCSDLENDGLICWGSSLGGGSAATGSGAPWDIRSWEAQPWFLRKWWILIGGAEGEIYKQTRWWCETRGEKPCYPW